MAARWTAYQSGNETIILRNGRRWGEVEVGPGFAVGCPVMRKPERFESEQSSTYGDKAWRHVLPDPLPMSLVYDLQDQAVANVLGVAV